MEELKTLYIEALLTCDFDAPPPPPQQRSFDLIGNNDFLTLLRYRMAGITESAMVAYTHKYAVV